MSFREPGRYWLVAGYEDGLYNHVLVPNSSVIDCSNHAENFTLGVIDGAAPPLGAATETGVNCLMMDGSAHFLKNSVSLAVWRALATRAGGEAISADSF